MAFAYAGLYGPQTILDQTSKEAANIDVTVYESNGSTVASLYTDQTMGTAAANPAVTDTLGNLKFFAAPGEYVLAFSIGGVATSQTVTVDPWFTDLTGQAVEAIGISGAWVGAAPSPSGPNYKIECGTFTAASDSNAHIILSFAEIFPNGVVMVIAQQGDINLLDASLIPAPSVSATTSAWTLYLVNTTTGVGIINSSSIHINWIAIGF
jgi:hypothetical protein